MHANCLSRVSLVYLAYRLSLHFTETESVTFDRSTHISTDTSFYYFTVQHRAAALLLLLLLRLLTETAHKPALCSSWVRTQIVR